MMVSFTILLGILGYINYKSKHELTLIESDTQDCKKDQLKDEDDLYNDLEDLFI